MFRLSRTKVILLGGYIVFNLCVMVMGMRVLGRMGSALGRVHFNMGEVLSQLLASLLPGPF